MVLDSSKHDAQAVLAHLLVLRQLRDKSKLIHRKIEEVTERLQHAQHAAEIDALDAQFARRKGENTEQSIVIALKELDDMLGQPSLITRDELRSRLQDLIHRLGEPGSV